MDAAYISAFFGLAGATIGGFTSFSTSWLTQRTQLREKRLEVARTTRQELFRAFIAEASRLHGNSLSHQKDDVLDLVQLYALVAQMRLMATRPVVVAAENVMDGIIQSYLAPNLTLHDIRVMASKGHMNFLVEFGEACRQELDSWQRA